MRFSDKCYLGKFSDTWILESWVGQSPESPRYRAPEGSHPSQWASFPFKAWRRRKTGQNSLRWASTPNSSPSCGSREERIHQQKPGQVRRGNLYWFSSLRAHRVPAPSLVLVNTLLPSPRWFSGSCFDAFVSFYWSITLQENLERKKKITNIRKSYKQEW